LLPLAAHADTAPGLEAPAFKTVDIAGKPVDLAALKGKYVILEWTNHLCPCVGKFYGSGSMQAMQKKYTAKGVVWISVISSAPGKQGYVTDEEAQKIATEKKSVATHIIRDPEGKIGRLYGARATPHMFIIDKEGKVAYMGAVDDMPSTDMDDVMKAHNYIDAAFDEMAAGKPITKTRTVAYGCGVKY
jgi:peroxiredoxin